MFLYWRLLWKTGNRPHFDKGGYIYVGGMIYIMDGGTGELCMVRPDPTSYREVARAKMLAAKPIWAPMAFSDGLLVILDQKTMKCMDLKNP
ncbi:MAG: hypothetical protein NTX50_06805 [Candidatus Sumerlaeota bacterium]|nr:hypothetical protein [Candidatus Sumerlaeota bacterium]